MSKLTNFVDSKDSDITLGMVLRQDILPWLIATGSMALLSKLITLIVLSSTIVHSEYSRHIAAGSVSGLSLLILGYFGCLIAIRSGGLRLWVTYIASVFFYIMSGGASIGGILFGNSLLTFMFVVMMVLSIERIIEYINIRYRLGLLRPRISIPSIVLYCIVAIICFNSIFGAWIL